MRIRISLSHSEVELVLDKEKWLSKYGYTCGPTKGVRFQQCTVFKGKSKIGVLKIVQNQLHFFKNITNEELEEFREALPKEESMKGVL